MNDGMPKLDRVHHISLNVDDTDECARFYTEQLGFARLPRPDFGFPGAWLDAGGYQIHLLELPDERPARSQHFAIAVDDLDGTCSALAARGVDVSEPRPVGGDGARQAFFRDPAGNLIELNQPGS